MPRPRGDVPIALSVLDRLTDEEFKVPNRPPLTRVESIRKLRDSVRNNLEWLLNTRQPLESARPGTQLNSSLYMYGLPDITSMAVKNTRDRQRLTQAIEAAVGKFEPRIANPRVSFVANEEEKLPVLHFIIEGLLRLDPNPEHVSFDTVLELSSGEYKVRGEAGAR